MSRDLRRRRRAQPRDRRGLLPGASGHVRAGGRSAASGPRRRTASTRRRTSARSAMAGAMTTNDTELAERARRLRNGGQTDRYHHGEFGVNSRLDELQAAVLRARLHLAPGWTRRRRELGRQYRRSAAGGAGLEVPPELEPGHVYHLFPVRSASSEALQEPTALRRHRNADSLPRSNSATAGTCHAASGRLPHRRPGLRMKCFPCRFIRRCARRRSSG